MLHRKENKVEDKIKIGSHLILGWGDYLLDYLRKPNVITGTLKVEGDRRVIVIVILRLKLLNLKRKGDQE
jgi:hypothetical protein